MIKPLCKSCTNKDIKYVFRDTYYKPELICDYELTDYPYATTCIKYAKEGVEQDIDYTGYAV
jgi:hypothetical protein